MCDERGRAQQLRTDLRSAEAFEALRDLETRTSSASDAAAIHLDRAAVLLDIWRVGEALAAIDVAAAELATGQGPGPDACGEPASEGPTRILELRARAARVRGAFAQSADEWDVALLRRRSQPPEPATLVRSLCLAAEAHWLAGHLDTMEALYAEAKELAETHVPGDELLLARIFLGQGWLAARRGELGPAESAYGRSLDLYIHAKGDAHPIVAGLWISLGSLAADREDLLTAAAMYEKARVILDPLSDPSVASDQAALRLNLGSVDARLGLVDSARTHFEAARQIWTVTRGPDHPHHAWVAEEIASLLEEGGRPAEAEAAQGDAVRLRDRSMPGSPSAVLTRARLAVLKSRAGRAADARALWVEVDAAAAKLTTAGGLFEASLMARRAEASEAQGDLALAERRRAAVVTLLAAQLPKEHPGLTEARIQQARLAWLVGRRREALRSATAALKLQRRVVADTIRTLPESAALHFADRTRDLRDLLLCSAASLPAGAKPSADELMAELAASRSLTARVLHERRADGAPAGALAEARRRYAALLWQPIASARDDYAARLESAQDTLESLERAAGRSAVSSSLPTQASTALWAALGPSDVLVSFGRYRCPAASGATAPTGYVAFVRARQGRTRVVRFPDATALDNAIAGWHDAIARAVYAPPTGAQDDLVATLGHALASILWAPLAAEIGAARRVFIVPDGALHTVSWYALPGTRGPYLIDEPRVLHVLSQESDLIDARSSGAPAGRAVVVLADPLVARASTAVADAALGAEVRYLRSACSFVDPTRLPRLAQAYAEARDVETHAHGAGRPVLFASGAAASESWLREHAAQAGILHLAAHGGLLSPESCREPSSAAGPTTVDVVALWEAAVRARPLMQSGLLLAGAAGFTPLDAPGTDDDGILVAEEAARLDLRGADWVVLSACSTRRGPVVDAEGALGLHRAFHSAGARTVIASLWDVQDAPARRFMQALYAARLRDGKSTAEAMRDAQRAVLAELRAGGRSTHPVQWAAFVASGDWR
ncbi:MAG: CHAT domain-containing tetratricopeptide repeat protein [Vicinamibacteria bacterium]